MGLFAETHTCWVGSRHCSATGKPGIWYRHGGAQVNLLVLLTALTAVLLTWSINHVLRIVLAFISALDEMLREES